jgi:hypothetical protein
VGAVSVGDAGRAMALASGSAELRRFLHALRAKKIPFLIVGMTAAVLQGVPVVTADVDFWIGTPISLHDAVMRICDDLGGKFHTDFTAELPGGIQLNFAYALAGLKGFAAERRQARRLRWLGEPVPVLSLQQIERSKKAVGRPKDKVHLAYIHEAMKLRRAK